MLQYSNGYVNVTGETYTVIEHTQTAAQCAMLCSSDAPCIAWTRVAGGRADVQSCYLKRQLGAVANALPQRKLQAVSAYIISLAAALCLLS